MTTPALAISTKYGRVYRKPTTKLADVADVPAALSNNLLMPSITNVIDVLSKPYLMNWYAKRAAEDAVQVSREHPGLIMKKPREAVSWIASAAKRTASAAAALGDEVHNAVESLSLGEKVVDVSPEAQKFIESWEQWVENVKPEFLFREATIFGVTELGGKAYAGTADFIAKINDKVFIGDYKTGKNVHAEAALQLSALSHGVEIVVDDTLVELPKIDGEIVLHLRSNGYDVFETTDSDAAWQTFSHLRELWEVKQEMQDLDKAPWGFRLASAQPGEGV